MFGSSRTKQKRGWFHVKKEEAQLASASDASLRLNSPLCAFGWLFDTNASHRQPQGVLVKPRRLHASRLAISNTCSSVHYVITYQLHRVLITTTIWVDQHPQFVNISIFSVACLCFYCPCLLITARELLFCRNLQVRIWNVLGERNLLLMSWSKSRLR